MLCIHIRMWNNGKYWSLLKKRTPLFVMLSSGNYVYQWTKKQHVFVRVCWSFHFSKILDSHTSALFPCMRDGWFFFKCADHSVFLFSVIFLFLSDTCFTKWCHVIDIRKRSEESDYLWNRTRYGKNFHQHIRWVSNDSMCWHLCLVRWCVIFRSMACALQVQCVLFMHCSVVLARASHQFSVRQDRAVELGKHVGICKKRDWVDSRNPVWHS